MEENIEIVFFDEADTEDPAAGYIHQVLCGPSQINELRGQHMTGNSLTGISWILYQMITGYTYVYRNRVFSYEDLVLSSWNYLDAWPDTPELPQPGLLLRGREQRLLRRTELRGKMTA